MKWKATIFDNVLRLNRGFDLPNQTIEDGPYPVVASTSIKAYHKAFKVEGPGVVTGRSGSLGTVQYLPGRFWPLNTSLYVKDFKGNNERFIAYFLQTMRLENFNSGAGVPTLNQNHLHKLSVKIPPLPTQRKIAAILTAYDDLIETNKRRIALLEKMAEELYREWFVRMRFPGYQNTRFVKGVPEGWEVKRLGEILELAYGKSLKASEREPGKFLVYGSGGIVGTHSMAIVQNKGIIVGRKGNVGAVYFSDRGFFPIDTVFYVVSELPLTFLFFLLRSLNFINNDAAVPGLNRNQAYSNQLLYPGRELITKFAKVADPIHDMKHQLQTQNNILTKTRDLLLPRLISGKLSVENLDIQFPPSMQEETPEPESAYAELHL